MNRIYLGITLILVSWGFAAHGATLASEIDGKLKVVDEAKSVLGGGKIYSKEVVEKSILKFENKELLDAGRELLMFLSANRAAYESLPVRDWVDATDALFRVDDSMNPNLAWGNLVIKMYVSEMVLRSIYERMKDENTIDELSVYKKTITELSSRLPSKVAMAEISSVYYGFSISENVNGLGYGKEIRRAEKFRLLEGNDASGLIDSVYDIPHFEKKFHQEVTEESERLLTFVTFDEMYEKPIPLVVSLSTNYRPILWNTYLMLVFAEKNITSSFEWNQLTLVELVGIYEKSGFSLGGIPEGLRSHIKGKGTSLDYLNRVRSGRPVQLLHFIWGGSSQRESVYQSVHNLQ